MVADWPPNSPDLSPIENAWTDIQGRVDRVGCKTFEHFKQTVLKEWLATEKKTCKALMVSSSRRMCLCVAGGGGKTRY
jgi:transposase